MQAPANGTGIGTRADPWRPKYLKELGLSYTIRNAREFCLAEVWGEEKALTQLAGMSDVEELAEDDQPVAAAKLSRVEARGLSLARKSTGREVIASLKRAIHDKQVAERPQRVGDAVRDAIRAGG